MYTHTYILFYDIAFCVYGNFKFLFDLNKLFLTLATSTKAKTGKQVYSRCMDDIPKQYNTAHSAWVWSNRAAKMINAAYVSENDLFDSQ